MNAVATETGDLFRECRNMPLTRRALLRLLSEYDFQEINDLRLFISLFCRTIPDKPSAVFIREKLAECLAHHDDGTPAFFKMHNMLKKVTLWIDAFDLPESFSP